MEKHEMFYIDIKGINIAHKFELNKNIKCEYYLSCRKYYGIIFALSGEAEYRFLDGNRLVIRPGEILLLSPKAAYTINTPKEFKHYTVNFELHEKNTNIEFLTKNFHLMRTKNTELYHHTFKNLVLHWTSRNIGYEMRATACLYELLAFFCAEIYEQKYSARSYQRLSPAKDYIERNFNKNISLALLSNLSDMSITHFRREWAKLYNSSPLQYRDTLRLNYAKEYLSLGYYSVTEVAEKCGFENTNYFIRFFKKHTGITPKNFSKL